MWMMGTLDNVNLPSPCPFEDQYWSNFRSQGVIFCGAILVCPKLILRLGALGRRGVCVGIGHVLNAHLPLTVSSRSVANVAWDDLSCLVSRQYDPTSIPIRFVPRHWLRNNFWRCVSCPRRLSGHSVIQSTQSGAPISIWYQ